MHRDTQDTVSINRLVYLSSDEFRAFEELIYKQLEKPASPETNEAKHPSQHAPTPYEVIEINHSTYIQTDKGEPRTRFVCDLGGNSVDTPEEKAKLKATAEFIVRACNAHKDLLEVCRVISASHAAGHLTRDVHHLLITAIDNAR